MSNPLKGDTSAVSNSNVVWTSLIAYVVLKENLHWLDWLAIPLTIGTYSAHSALIPLLVGIFFFAQPTFIFGDNDSEFSTLGLVFALASSILAASCFNIIRKIGKNVHYTVTVLYYSVLGTIITAAITLYE